MPASDLPTFFLTIVNPVQQKYLTNAAHTQGVVLEGAKEAKWVKYHAKLEVENIAFLPMVFESFGGWEADGVQLVKKLARMVARNQGREEDGSNRYAYQKIGVALQKGNGLILTGRKSSDLPPLR